jgi:hypothetical protein
LGLSLFLHPVRAKRVSNIMAMVLFIITGQR